MALGLLDDHVRHCMHRGALDGGSEAMAEEMMATVGCLMR
ncbi:DNA-binding FrmR family transcriptional regulator [Actinomadura namibiensis]|uniref:DNA-binding FrmR family transcriptional regulator n=1 Tax=Actinomadura namibiensis TaxID=182080 RepID=A0A7W3QS20_ACTNM|nr:DNA-binding FrmR family transcriptional regulator [Actinomadura namibiensis]